MIVNVFHCSDYSSLSPKDHLKNTQLVRKFVKNNIYASPTVLPCSWRWKIHLVYYFLLFQAFDVAEEHLGIPPQISASEMAMKEVPDTLMIVSYVSQYHEVFKNETPGKLRLL